jgi:pyruvate dehydrogenase E2 component (dihydrolipoamide acetyltransferase)
MATIIRMPGVLAGADEAALAGWLVAVGDSISVGDPIAEIETEKATVEYAAESSGVLGRTLIEAGDSSDVGAAIAVLLDAGEGEADIDAVLAGAPTPDGASAGGASAGGASVGGGGDKPAVTGDAPAEVVARDPDSAAPVVESSSLDAAAKVAGDTAPAPDLPPVSAASSDADEPRPESRSGERLFASPLARRLAREKSIDLTEVAGTGPRGRISRRDLELFEATSATSESAAVGEPPAREAAQAAPAVPEASGTAPATPDTAPRPAHPAGPAEWDEVPHTGMRKAIARRLTESKSTVPHFYLTTDCRVDALLALRATINASSPVRISVNDLVVKAAAAAFADVPDANVTWTPAAMRRHKTVDIAVAVATDGGLLTPVLRNAGTLSLSAISSGITELAGRARDRKLKQEELEGGSFSVTNLGMYGTLEFAAILNPPQSGILAVGAASKQPVVDENGELAVGTVMRCTLSVDHRAVDGALAAQWLAAFTRRVENPLTILL